MTLDILRDPLYGPVPLDPIARQLIDTPEFQRLRQIRQLSMASTVYPSGVHTRFEHAVGVYHLSGVILRHLAAAGEMDSVDPEDGRLIRYACLLHDLGHFSGAHLLEEVGYPGASHEHAGADQFSRGEIGKILRNCGIPRADRRIGELVTHNSKHVLAGIVSGDVDADKLDYLIRDAYHCGLPAVFDQGHLVHALTLVADPETGARQLGLRESGTGAFEAMLYAKFTLYRTVYFHPVVRSATAMMRALLVAALDAGVLEMDELHQWTDDQVFTLLLNRVAKKRNPDARQVRVLCDRLQRRDLFKAAAWVPLTTVGDAPLPPQVLIGLERQLEQELGLSVGEVLLDRPRKPTMLSTDLLVLLNDGEVAHMRDLGTEHGLALPSHRPAFYAASGRIHCFTAQTRSMTRQRLETIMRDAAAGRVAAVATAESAEASVADGTTPPLPLSDLSNSTSAVPNEATTT